MMGFPARLAFRRERFSGAGGFRRERVLTKQNYANFEDYLLLIYAVVACYRQ
jgi:hypothetical protein